MRLTWKNCAYALVPPLTLHAGLFWRRLPISSNFARQSYLVECPLQRASDAVELGSDEEDEGDDKDRAITAYKGCAGKHCTVFNHGKTKRDALLSTHKCLDCKEHVHAPRDVPLDHVKTP